MNEIIWKVRNTTDKCFEETMKRVMVSDPKTNIYRLIECIFNDYKTDNLIRNSIIIMRMYQYCITEFKMKDGFGRYKNIASKVMDYDKEYFAVSKASDEL